MSAVGTDPIARSRTHESSFRTGAWRLDGPRVAAGCCMLVFAVTLAGEPGLARVVAPLLVVDVALQALPWRVPRDTRSTASIWAETACYQLAPLAVVAVSVARRPAWLTAAPAPPWYAAAVAAGTLVVVVSGIDLRALASGDLAFVAGPLSRAHAASLTAGSIVAVPCEEVVFRGAILMVPSALAFPVGAVAATAFVARHHLAPAASARTSVRGLVTQIVAALSLLGLTIGSRSLYPAIVAHLVNNAPWALLALQRGRSGGPS